MDMTEHVSSTTVGKLAAFVMQVLEAGASLDTPVEMRKGRTSKVTAITVSLQVAMPFDSSAAAVVALDGAIEAAKSADN